jgi:hypothetical protein
MTTLSDPGRRPAPAHLGLLLQEVFSARAFLAAARTRGNPEVTRRARSLLCEALKAYTEALNARALPVPYAVRDELWLLRHVPW